MSQGSATDIRVDHFCGATRSSARTSLEGSVTESVQLSVIFWGVPHNELAVEIALRLLLYCSIATIDTSAIDDQIVTPGLPAYHEDGPYVD